MAVTLGASSAATALDIDGWTTLDQGLLIVSRAWPAIQMQFCCFSAGADSVGQRCPHHAPVQFVCQAQILGNGKRMETLEARCHLTAVPPES